MRQSVKTKTVYLAVVLLFVLSAVIPATATNGLDFVGSGPVQEMMGGASTALPLDAGTLFSNPAGIGKIGTRIDLGLTYLFDADPSYTARGVFPGIVQHDGAKITSEISTAMAPFTGAAYKINDSWAIGLAVHHSGMRIRYPANVYFQPTENKSTFTRIAPGISHAITPQLSVGVSGVVAVEQITYKFGTFAEPEHTKGNSFGVGGIFGALYDVTDWFSVGIQYETPIRMSEFKFDTVYGQDKLRLNRPQKASLGIAIKPLKTLRFAADFKWINWSHTHGAGYPMYTQLSSPSSSMSFTWRDQNVYRIGAEWDAFSFLTLRAGFNYGKSPVNYSRAYETFTVPAFIEQHYSAGVGIKVSDRLMLNLGYVYAPKNTERASTVSGQFLNDVTTTYGQQVFEADISYTF